MILLILFIVFTANLFLSVDFEYERITFYQILYIICHLFFYFFSALIILRKVLPEIKLRFSKRTFIISKYGIAIIYALSIYIFDFFKKQIFQDKVMYIDFSYLFVTMVMLIIIFYNNLIAGFVQKEEL